MQSSSRIPPMVLYGLPLICAAAVKLLIWSPQVTPFNSDEAIVALMARHINQGQLMPFFYGQYYMGSLDAILVSGFFKFFGEHVWVIRLVQSVLFLGTVTSTILLAHRILGDDRAALFAGFLIAIPPVSVTLYTTVSLGGYGEMLLIGNLLLLGGLGILEQVNLLESFNNWRLYFGLFAWSLGAGFAFWVIGLSLVYTLPILLMLGLEFSKTAPKTSRVYLTGILSVCLGLLIGSAPWWFSALLSRNHSIIAELFGGAIADVNPGFWMLKPVIRLGSLIVFGVSVITGMRPPWGVTWLMLPLLPFVLIFWLAVFVHAVNQMARTREQGKIILLLQGVILSLGFIFSPYGEDPSGRYFLPLIVPMAIMGADLITNQFRGRPRLTAGLLLLVLVFNLGGTLQSRFNNPPGLTTQFDPATQVNHLYLDDLLKFLNDQDIRTGYSSYWAAYPIAFLSGEQITFSPRLPYHQDFRYTERDDRYPLYTELAQSSDNIAYLTTRNPALDVYLRRQFRDLNITWKEKKIGDYTVYYDLSAPIHVGDIGLGVTTQP